MPGSERPGETGIDPFTARAQKYWTKERTAKLTSGKRYQILPHQAGLLLRTIGLLNADASMSADSVRKYTQVNHLVSLFERSLLDLAGRHDPVRILDAGCGKSYLSFLLAWCFKNIWQKNTAILGVDASAALIEKCQKMAEKVDLSAMMTFTAKSLSEVEVEPRPHFLVALHACDTATDMALALGIRSKADVIAVAPCCQAELAAKWKEMAGAPAFAEHPLAPIFHAPELRRETAADMTDALRMLLLRGCGYEVTTTEFVASTHTPKNRLILATRRGNYLQSAMAQYSALRAHLGGTGIHLETLLPDELKARLS